MLRYRASKLDCDACALKPRCCPTQPARKILRSVHEGARDLAAMEQMVAQFMSVIRAEEEGPGACDNPAEAILPLIEDWRSEGRDVAADIAPVPVPLGAAALQRLVQNLVENALRYGAEPVRVDFAEDGDHVRLAVHDAGEGVAEADWPRLTEPFTRLEQARPVTGSTGLGLYIVRRLVEGSGGTLGFARGEGFAVIARWPRAD